MNLNRRFSVEQPKGPPWEVFHDKDDPSRYVAFTQAGREVMLHDRVFKPDLRSYKDVALKAATDGDTSSSESMKIGADKPIRGFLGEGQQAKVYTMGKRYAVRETPGTDNFYSGVSELQRMNALAGHINAGAPRWIQTPEHFLRMSDPHTGKVYTVMQRADDGITVEDILNYPDTPRAGYIEKRFPRLSPNEADRAVELFDKAHGVLKVLIEKAGENPDDVLVDWKPRNAIYKPLRTPIADHDRSLSIIDQY